MGQWGFDSLSPADEKQTPSLAALSFPDSKNVSIYPWVDRERVFQSSDGKTQPRTHDCLATFCIVTEPL